MNKFIYIFISILSCLPGKNFSQTLFHYGDDSVSVEEFLNAYQKNNTGVRSEKAFREYLDLYIHSRLKVKEAKQRGYDTLPQLVADLENLRQQILPNYLNDRDEVNRLVQEAFMRAQKNIHLAHVFIAKDQPGDDAAKEKAGAVRQLLKEGKDFAEVARNYSNDPAAKTNGGDLGWITVFSLPYELENLAYNTPVGEVSAIYESRAGYHIFKNLGERRDPGKIRAAQILLAFPPDADAQTKAQIKGLADSLYNRILQGDDFGKLAAAFSNDVVSAAANGQLPEFGTGQYDPEFENEAFALAKDGAVTKPFLTAYGYHIVKRLGRTPASTVHNEKLMQYFRDRVEQSDRINVTKKALAKKILKQHYKALPFSTTALYAYTDSVLNFVQPAQKTGLGPQSALFQIGDKKISVADWTSYAQTFRYKPDGSGLKTYPVIWDEFLETMAIDYYQNHLEDFNPSFRQQLAEFRDGNLFFEIMQREIWGPAQTDSVALENYYQKNKSRYHWKQSADAVIFYATDAAAAKTFSEQLKKSPSSWASLVNNFSERIAADSSRFELPQIPNPTRLPLKPGTITGLQVNKADNTASFAYIVRVYHNSSPRSFPEARGLVIIDYQNELEKNWIAGLKQKYPVRINQKVWNELVRKKRY